MFKVKVFTVALCIFMLTICGQAMAGGIALGSTRVIYPIGEKQVSLAVTNSDERNVFLIQSWVAGVDGKKDDNFIVTPPLFVIKPKKENTLRIMYAGPELPSDRETVFYLNSKAIPSVDKSTLKGSTLQIATQSVIKVFMRPKKLPTQSVDVPKSLKCNLSNGILSFTNPSPYYASIVQLFIGNHHLQNTMVSPKNTLNINVPAGVTGTVSFQTINDFGATTKKQSCIN